MKYVSFLAVFLWATSSVFAQTTTSLINANAKVQSDTLRLNIVIPETDTVIYGFSRYRVAANTNPDANAYINGRPVKVYESGAFIDFLSLKDDTTEIVFKVERNGMEKSKRMLLIKPEPPEPLDASGKVISPRLMKPASDLWLNTGEVLEVQFLGTPGQEVVFNIDYFKNNIPMKEVPEEIAGVKGLYRGSYEVKSGDRVKNEYITFKMKKGLFGYHKKKSAYKVSFNGLPRVAEVTEEGAYLNIGMGTDRLGGAKYGELEEGVKLNIIGLKNDNYKVKLSDNLSAWIPAEFVELKSEFEQPAVSLTGNIRVRGRAHSNLITLTLSEKLPYISYQELEPNKIIVDVFGATSNTNWKIKHESSNEGIERVDWRQMEDGRFRLIIKLNQSQNWGYTVGYGWGSQMNIKVRKPPLVTNVVSPLEGQTISVDAGHGGSNKGSLGAAGYQEKDVTLEITMKLKELLEEKGAKVVLPRTNDDYVYMRERKEITLEHKADVLVSIHTNSIGYTTDPLTIKGTGSFYKHIAFKPLAEIMYANMRSLGFDDYGLTGSFNFSLNQPIEFPNVLVETGFISHPEEEMKLTDPEFQYKMAEQIVAGLEEFFMNYGRIESVYDMPDK